VDDVIGWLRGHVITAVSSPLVVACGDVGYEVHVPTSVLVGVERGAQIELWVRTLVRTDAIVLYGFRSQEERTCFDALLGVSGVGPQLALAIVGSLEVADLWSAIASEDVGRLTRVNGVGPKTARRVVLELGPRARGFVAVEPVVIGGTSIDTDARAALLGLGFRAKEVEAVLARCPAELDLEDRLRWALRELGR